MDKKEQQFSNYIMLAGILLVLGSLVIGYYEFFSAQRFCDSVNGEYYFKFTPLPPEHYCNNQTLAEYEEGWDFEREEIGEIRISLPD